MFDVEWTTGTTLQLERGISTIINNWITGVQQMIGFGCDQRLVRYRSKTSDHGPARADTDSGRVRAQSCTWVLQPVPCYTQPAGQSHDIP